MTAPFWIESRALPLAARVADDILVEVSDDGWYWAWDPEGYFRVRGTHVTGFAATGERYDEAVADILRRDIEPADPRWGRHPEPFFPEGITYDTVYRDTAHGEWKPSRTAWTFTDVLVMNRAAGWEKYRTVGARIIAQKGHNT